MDSLVIYIVLLTTDVIVSLEVDMTKVVTTSATIPGHTNGELGNDSVTNIDGRYKTEATTYVQHSNDNEEKGSSTKPTRQSTREMNALRETNLTTLTNTAPTSASNTTSSPLTQFNTASSIGVKTLSNKPTLISSLSTKHETEMTANVQQSNSTEQKGSSTALTKQFTKEMTVLSETTQASFTNTSTTLASTKVSRHLTKLITAALTTATSLSNKPTIISTFSNIFSTKAMRPLSKSTSSSIKQSTSFESESKSFKSVIDKVTTQLKPQHGSRDLITTPKTGCLENQTSEVQISTTEPKFCKTGSCGGADSCIRALANTECKNGVCTKFVTRRNATYSDYDLSCNTTFTNCDSFFISTATSTSGSMCCDTSPCGHYISSSDSSTSVVAVNAFLMIITLVSIYFRML